MAPPGGGTTDYAVEMFYHALRYKHYTCFLKPDTRLDMMYIPDAIRAMIELLEAAASRLRHRNAYNVTAMSITPAELATEVRKHVPDFAIDYEIDPIRQSIADSWPRSLDDSAAREDWGFAPQFDLAATTVDMLARLSEKAVRYPALSSRVARSAAAMFSGVSMTGTAAAMFSAGPTLVPGLALARIAWTARPWARTAW
jgi:nucleoside-diphosphate-sugar epimerase